MKCLKIENDRTRLIRTYLPEDILLIAFRLLSPD